MRDAYWQHFRDVQKKCWRLSKHIFEIISKFLLIARNIVEACMKYVRDF